MVKCLDAGNPRSQSVSRLGSSVASFPKKKKDIQANFEERKLSTVHAVLVQNQSSVCALRHSAWLGETSNKKKTFWFKQLKAKSSRFGNLTINQMKTNKSAPTTQLPTFNTM